MGFATFYKLVGIFLEIIGSEMYLLFYKRLGGLICIEFLGWGHTFVVFITESGQIIYLYW